MCAQGVLNHAELVVELARALGDIADVLPHITLGMDLYPTVYMKEAVSRVYAHIMLFLNKAAKWYSMSPARRALSAISKPYSIGYKDTVHQIRLCADSVNLVAGAAGRAELRDLTIIIQEQTARLQARDYDLDLMKSTLQRLCGSADASEKKLFQILHFAQSKYFLTVLFSKLNSTGSQSISGATLLEVKDHGVRLRDIQFSTILETLKPERSPADVLIACNFLAQRRQLWKQPTHESVKFIQTFNQWVNGPASSLFVLQAGLRAEARAKDLAVQAITLLKDSLHTVFWYLSERRPTQNDLNITDVLQTLVFQVLARHPDIFESHPEIVNVTAFKSDHTEQEWLTLLSVVLSHLPKCFLVVEMEGLHNITAQSELGRQLLQAFKQLVDNLRDNDNLLKVLLVHYGVPSMAGASTGVGLGNYSTYVRAPLMGAAGVNMGRAAKLRRKGKVGGRH